MSGCSGVTCFFASAILGITSLKLKKSDLFSFKKLLAPSASKTLFPASSVLTNVPAKPDSFVISAWSLPAGLSLWAGIVFVPAFGSGGAGCVCF